MQNYGALALNKNKYWLNQQWLATQYFIVKDQEQADNSKVG